MITPAMARNIEIWPTERLVPYGRNARTHSPAQVSQIAASIVEFGFLNPILVDSSDGIVAGHGRLLAARQLGLAELPVVILDHLTAAQRRAYIIADNKLALNAGWHEKLLAAELGDLALAGVDLALIGFTAAELDVLLPGVDEPVEEASEEIPEPPATPVTQPGDIWQIGPHRLICGDCRDANTLRALFGSARANVAITSPPYAVQREYDPSSGFKPVPPEQYVEWFRPVAAGIASILAPDGSYFLNIKSHASDGERNLYVVDLLIAHKRQWGWRFIDEFCWRKTDDGVPGGWGNRFKNAWEPVYHFSRQSEIKFRPQAVGHASADCFDYSPDNPVSKSGSGLLGTGPRGGSASSPPEGSQGWGHMRRKLMDGRHEGIARPSNVIEVKTESSQGSHSAPFPRPLIEFFAQAFSDPGDVIFDPFMGSGTSMAAAQVLGRAGYGVEISPGYCDLILSRMMNLTGHEPIHESGATFAEIAAARGIDPGQALNPKAPDAGAIKHHGPNPHDGPRRKAS